MEDQAKKLDHAAKQMNHHQMGIVFLEGLLEGVKMSPADRKKVNEKLESLKESFKEMPLLTGRASDEAKSILSFWMNPIDNSWSIIATNKDLSCVIGIGTNFNLLNYKTGKEV